MSREELIGAYTDGKMSRRAFVRSLVVLGVSAGAAVAYADSLAAAPKSRPAAGPEYPVYPEYPGSSTTSTTTTTAAVGAVGAGQVGAANSGTTQSAQAKPRFTG